MNRADVFFNADARANQLCDGFVIASEALGMTVIAEGIETFEELAYLQAATRIRYAQGYYFARPILLEELKPVIRILSESRVTFASRPPQESRPAYSRGER